MMIFISLQKTVSDRQYKTDRNESKKKKKMTQAYFSLQEGTLAHVLLLGGKFIMF